MRTLAVLPLNSLSAAKSRLRGMLGEVEREALVRWLAERTLAALCGAGIINRVAVVSPDPVLLAWARERCAVAIPQETDGLNDGLELGRRWALAEGAEALLIVLGDLPLLAAEEVRALVAMLPLERTRPLAVLAPDRDARGTNMLLLRPPDALPFAFGAESLARHLTLARAWGLETRRFESPGTRFDVDYPADVEDLRRRGLWSPESLKSPGTPDDACRGVVAGGETR